ncbi:aminotransferase-like domain-containing protein [Gellertiella hungarica]|uniref:DNA-binding transcriptional MocR family regulator n=1 Tax=Gellertiella hungarica TaxID=1572859 RepID=A0A7W6J5J6_9HYPH|nr:PLP-dependent aminotransferase family protein [Gellertiella hungarica]MBB4064323.1 DNA-binding transcriptional MocR family regulator [Gellertiella hungarica]
MLEETPRSRTRAVIGEIERRIASRSLVTGARLPSVRVFAKTMGVSPSTVVEAYERLAAQGVIRSRPGSGFYVAQTAAPLAIAEIGPRLDRAVDPLWISRQALEERADLLKPGCGWLPSDWMPEAALQRALKALSRQAGAALTDYDSPKGLPALRQWLSRRMMDRGIPAGPDGIVLVDSGTQAIDLICRFLLEPGDTVLVDDPCYFNFHALLRAHRARVVGVPMTPEGPDTDAFARIVAAEKPRLYITTAGMHNPTGAVMAPVTAHRLIRLAADAGMSVIEDDIFGDLENRHQPRLAAIDGLQRVIAIGSFSKTLSAAARSGYVALRADWVDPLVDLKIATGFSASRLSAELVLSVLSDGSYRRHAEQLRVRLGRAMDETIRRVRALGLEPWIEPEAGLFLWCRLPEGVEAAGLARACLAENIVLAPGDAFSPSGAARQFLRFNVAQSADDRIWQVLERLLAGP